MTNAVLLLKRLPRSGWVESCVKNPESVADHSYGLAVLAMVEADRRGLDTEKAVKMALIHDLPESFTGDLTPKTKKKIPHRLLKTVEKSILKQLFSGFPSEIVDKYLKLYEEYVRERSAEARLVHRLDIIEMMHEAKWLTMT